MNFWRNCSIVFSLPVLLLKSPMAFWFRIPWTGPIIFFLVFRTCLYYPSTLKFCNSYVLVLCLFFFHFAGQSRSFQSGNSYLSVLGHLLHNFQGNFLSPFLFSLLEFLLVGYYILWNNSPTFFSLIFSCLTFCSSICKMSSTLSSKTSIWSFLLQITVSWNFKLYFLCTINMRHFS